MPGRGLLCMVAVATMVMLGPVAPAHAATPLITTVTVTPNTGLTDGQTVQVTGTGFTAPAFDARGYLVAQCAGDLLATLPTPDLALQRCDFEQGVVYVQPDSGGAISTAYSVRKNFVVAGSTSVSCGEAPNDCAVIVTALTDFGPVITGALVDFTEPPTITVVPDAHLHSHQTVTVTGAGFTAKPLVNDWALAQCSAGILDVALDLNRALEFCDATTQPFVFTHADAAGNLTSPFTVRRNFTTSNGTKVRCGRTPNACAVLVAQITDRGFVGAAAAIDFSPPEATKKADCLHNQWKHHGRANGSHFASQRSCLSYVKHRN